MDEKELVIEAVFKVAPLAAHKGPSECAEVDFCVRVRTWVWGIDYGLIY